MLQSRAPQGDDRRLRPPLAGLLMLLVLAGTVAGGRACAQQTPAEPPPAATPAPPAAAAKKPVDPEAADTPATVIDDKQIESILGKSVLSPTGEDMGRITDILVDKAGALRAAVIDFGGFFGVGSRKIAVDWYSLHFKSDGRTDAIVAALPPGQLRKSPVYKEGEPVVILGRAAEGEARAAEPKPAPAAAPSAPAATAPTPAPNPAPQ